MDSRPGSPRKKKDSNGIIPAVERLLAWERNGRDACRKLRKLVSYEKLRGQTKLSDVFGVYDASKSGNLTQKEWNKALEDLGVTSDVNLMSALFSNFDADHDGQLTYTEFVNGVSYDDEKGLARLGIRLRSDFARHPDAVYFHRVFARLDVDVSGVITSDEFLMTMDTLGIRNIDEADALVVFEQVDTDQSGDLDFIEFLHAVTLCAIQSAEKDQAVLDSARRKIQLLDRHRRAVHTELEAFHKQLREAEMKASEYRKKAAAQYPGPGKRQLLATAKKWDETLATLQTKRDEMQSISNPEEVELTPEERRLMKHAHVVKRHMRNIKGLADEGGLKTDPTVGKAEYDLLLEKGTMFVPKPPGARENERHRLAKDLRELSKSLGVKKDPPPAPVASPQGQAKRPTPPPKPLESRGSSRDDPAPVAIMIPTPPSKGPPKTFPDHSRPEYSGYAEQRKLNGLGPSVRGILAAIELRMLRTDASKALPATDRRGTVVGAANTVPHSRSSSHSHAALGPGEGAFDLEQVVERAMGNKPDTLQLPRVRSSAAPRKPTSDGTEPLAQRRSSRSLSILPPALTDQALTVTNTNAQPVARAEPNGNWVHEVYQRTRDRNLKIEEKRERLLLKNVGTPRKLPTEAAEACVERLTTPLASRGDRLGMAFENCDMRSHEISRDGTTLQSINKFSFQPATCNVQMTAGRHKWIFSTSTSEVAIGITSLKPGPTASGVGNTKEAKSWMVLGPKGMLRIDEGMANFCAPLQSGDAVTVVLDLAAQDGTLAFKIGDGQPMVAATGLRRLTPFVPSVDVWGRGHIRLVAYEAASLDDVPAGTGAAERPAATRQNQLAAPVAT